jgi:3-phosphoshikimate 1-carboxyvinyltransferase
MVCAAIRNGALIYGTDRLKIKESDRASAMAEELKKFGINAEMGDNKIVIPDVILKAPTEAICCHNDHRIAMSFAVLCSITGGELKGAECVNKSYPEFFNDIEKLGITYIVN